MRRENSIKNVIIVVLVLITTCVMAQQTQNNIWSLPPYYYKTGFPPQLLPSDLNDPMRYNGQPSQYSHNAMQDAQGNLLFFVVDGQVFDKNGYLIDNLVNYNVISDRIWGVSEFVIIPDPGNCKRYYFITQHRWIGSNDFSDEKLFYGILDLSASNNFAGYPGEGSMIYFNEGNMVDIENYFGLPICTNVSPHKVGDKFIAATNLRNDNSRYVFISFGDLIRRFKITNTGIQYEGVLTVLNNGTCLNNSLRSEMELISLSNGNYRIACPYVIASPANAQGSVYIYVADIDANTLNIISNTEKYLNLGYLNYVRGIEFSPNGDLIYFTTENFGLQIYDLINQHYVSYGLSLPNDIKYSFIEYGKNDKMYFAMQNSIAALSNPNNPDFFTNWNSNAIAINYNLSNSNVSPFNFPGKSAYTLPDQIDGMIYTQHFFANQNCCRENNDYDKLSYTATANQTWTASQNPLNNGTGNTAYIRDNIIIPAGRSITIQGMNIHFAPGAEFIVQQGNSSTPGGRLILNNCTLTVDNRCGANQMWRGVVVRGNVNGPQNTLATSRHAWLIMNNNSVIEYATTGAFADRGGVIQATNSAFINNRTGVQFNNFQNINHINGGLIDNISFFDNTNFISNQQILNFNTIPAFFARIAQTDGIRFIGCNFINQDPLAFPIQNRGIGIQGNDARITVMQKCTFPTTINCTNFIPCNFENLNYGIRINNIAGLKPLTCTRSNFNNNFRGAELSFANVSRITENNFKALKDNQYTYGLYLNNCTGYKVEANDFTHYPNSNIADNGTTYGIIVTNSGSAPNIIYRNTFHNLYIGGQSQGINAEAPQIVNINGTPYEIPSNIGLRWQCNTFYNAITEADLAYTSGRIAYQQGFCASASSPFYVAEQTPAGNLFSHNTNNPYNDFFANIGFTLDVNYAHHQSLPTTPLSYTQSVITTQACNVNYNPNNSCPNNLGKLSKSLLQQRLSDIKTEINNEYHKIDGGNTAYLINAINSNMSVGDLKNLLMQYSPYLSDEVLLAYLSKNNIPSGHYRDVLIANSPLSPVVNSAYAQKNLPPGIKNQVNASQTGVSAMQYLYNYTSYLSSERTNYLYELIYEYLTDTLIVNPLDSVALLLRSEESELAKELLASVYQDKRDSTGVVEIIDEIIIDRGYDNFCKLHEKVLDIKQADTYCQAVRTDSLLRSEVEAIAYDISDRRIAVNAEALLEMSFDTLYNEVVEPLFYASNQKVHNNSPSIFNYEESAWSKSVYPIPAKDMLFVDLGEIEFDSEYTIEIIDYTGRKVMHLSHKDNSTISVNVSELKNGIYLINILKDNEEYSKHKAIINK